MVLKGSLLRVPVKLGNKALNLKKHLNLKPYTLNRGQGPGQRSWRGTPGELRQAACRGSHRSGGFMA